MIPERWEHGSEFHWPLLETLHERTLMPWGNSGLLVGSGRDAFRVLLDFGRRERGWQRLRIPSYFCQEVAAALLECGLPVEVYEDRPTAPTNPLPTSRAGDIVLIVNTFSLRGKPASYQRPPGVEVIEDHTHDPWAEWAFQSEADWCVASLRKVVPVPDGGVVWSPSGLPLPAAVEPTNQHESAALRKFTAMALKAAYLAGAALPKDSYRALSIAGEECIAGPTAAAMPTWSASQLEAFPINTWRRRKRDNFMLLSEALAGVPGVEVLRPSSPEAIPFSAIVLFPSREVRDRVRSGLIAERIYPAVLWQMDTPAVEGIPVGCRALAGAHLSLHCDFRYRSEDMLRVAATLKRVASDCL